MSASTRRRGDAPALLALFLVSCLVHGGVAWLAAAGGTALTGDEGSYFERASAFSRILGSLLRGEPLAASDLDAAYQRGAWPPLHPLLLGAVTGWLPDALLGARLQVALLASLTTVVVQRLGVLLFSRPAGWMAAGLHLGSPIFLGFSHFLWSETLYVLLFLALFGVVVRRCESVRPDGELRQASAAGALLGAMALTRSAVAPFYALLPLLLWFTGSRRRRALSVACFLFLASGLAAPWHWAMWRKEGRPILFSTHANVQLYLGNNPSASHLISYEATQVDLERGFEGILRQVQEQAALTGRHPSDAARDLALAFIREHPLAFLRRSAERGLLLLSGDSFVLRHALAVVHPPLGTPSVVALWLCGHAFGVATLALGLATLLLQPLRRPATLVAWLFVLASALPPLLTVSASRLGLPLLAVLLPYAGQGGWACLRRLPGWRRLGLVAAALAAVLLVTATALLPVNYRVLAQPSSFHAPLLAALDRLYPGETLYRDLLWLRDAGGGGLELRLDPDVRGELAEAGAPSGARELRWSGPGTRRIALAVRGVVRPPRLWLRRPGEAWIALEPIGVESWRSWTPAPVAGVSTYWSGSGAAFERGAP
jgi:4-amino-4-deoxy-L-arabinose transferase-like glycosyltransferase